MATNTVLDLPEEIIEKILSALTYDDLSHARMVCKSFDNLCGMLLNQGFSKADKLHSKTLKDIKSKLPRRESERRNHKLSRHANILAAVETRLSLLSMTYSKYIDLGLCCFIPGKVLDELIKVLNIVKSTDTMLPRGHDLLQELRDISSMAMEHFDEKIMPGLKTHVPPMSIGSIPPFSEASTSDKAFSDKCILFAGAISEAQRAVATTSTAEYKYTPLTMPADALTSSTTVRQPAIRGEVQRLRQNVRGMSNCLVIMRKEINENKAKTVEQKKKTNEQDEKLLKQVKTLTEQGNAISDLKRKVTEYDQKFSDVMAELSRLRNHTGIDRLTVSRLGEPDIHIASRSSRNMDDSGIESCSPVIKRRHSPQSCEAKPSKRSRKQ